MARFSKFYPQIKVGFKLKNDKIYVDYKDIDELARLVSINGKILPRQRTRLSAREQRLAARAVKRARFMGLLPYDSQGLSPGRPRDRF